MNKILIISIGLMTFLFGCGNDNSTSEGKTDENTDEQEGQLIETPGFEGTIKGPDYVNVRNINHIDSAGNVTKNPLIEINDQLEFEIERTEKSLDSLKKVYESDPFDEFGRYIETGENYFIIKAADFMQEPDSVYKVVVWIKGKDYNYHIHNTYDIANGQDASILLEYALGYKPATR